MKQIKSQIEKYNKGCGKERLFYSEVEHKWFNCGDILNSDKIVLCHICEARKKAFINGCLMMIESDIEFLDWIKYRDDDWNEKAIHNKIQELLSLKEYLEGEIK